MTKGRALRQRKGKVWMIGLDGATFRLIEPWAQSGKLPALARLMENGVWGILRSPVPQSPPAWASLMTGNNPGRHGIFEWIQPYPQSYKEHVTHGSSCDSPTLWRLISDCGRRVGVVNVPMTYPPENVNGFLVSGFDTPYRNEEFTHPISLLKELSLRFGPYTVLPQIIDIPLFETIQNFMDTIEQREKIMHFLLDREALDFFALVFNAPDSIQHLCLSGFGDKEINSRPIQALLSVYQRLDAVLAGLLERMPDDVTLFVLSDHGAGPLHAYFHLDNWLAGQGWLCFAEKSPRLALRKKGAQLTVGIQKELKRLLSERARRRIRVRWKGLKSFLDSASSAPRLDWSRTRAFSFLSQGIYINVNGRQPSGPVQPGREYEQWCDRITEALYRLRDPEQDRPVVARVLRKEELFFGPHLDVAPDLYIHWTDDAYLSWNNPLHSQDQLFVRPEALEMYDTVSQRNYGRHVGCHQQEGILILYGSLVMKGKRIPESSIMDVVPTILYLMGEAVPVFVEGKVIKGAITAEYLRNFPIGFSEKSITKASRGRGYSEDEIKQAEKKLRDLGYL